METFEFDIETLTLGEIEEIEDLTDTPFDQLEKGKKAKMLRAIAYVVKKRENPKYKYEDTKDLVIKVTEDDPKDNGNAEND